MRNSTGTSLGSIDLETKIFTPYANEESNAFHWIFYHLVNGTLPDDMVAMHTNSCIRCCAELTDPISMALGIGPYCSGPVIRKLYKKMIKEDR